MIEMRGENDTTAFPAPARVPSSCHPWVHYVVSRFDRASEERSLSEAVNTVDYLPDRVNVPPMNSNRMDGMIIIFTKHRRAEHLFTRVASGEMSGMYGRLGAHAPRLSSVAHSRRCSDERTG